MNLKKVPKKPSGLIGEINPAENAKILKMLTEDKKSDVKVNKLHHLDTIGGVGDYLSLVHDSIVEYYKKKPQNKFVKAHEKPWLDDLKIKQKYDNLQKLVK